MSKANSIQIAGDHYQSKFQHWDWVVTNQMDYFQANITKYITRHHKKNGVDDLMKAQHYLTKYLEMHDAGCVAITTYAFPQMPARVTAAEYSVLNDLSVQQARIMALVLAENKDKSKQTQLSEALAYLKKYTVDTYGTGDIGQGDQQ